MKQKLYRGTTLKEALRMLDQHIPPKYLYRITDRKEADSYALVNKIDDTQGRGAVVAATLMMPKQHKLLSPHEYSHLEELGYESVLGKQVGLYRTSAFDVIITPPSYRDQLLGVEVVKVI